MTAPTRAHPNFPLSFRFARLAGIDLKVHLTMVLLFGWILLEHMRTQDWGMLAEGMALVVCMFGAVLLHELGHALTARRFGIRTRDITLLPIGGVSTLERLPKRPREELAVAFAGPLVNVAIAALLFVGLVAAQLVVDVRVLSLVGGPFVAKLVLMNLSLAAFNLLPAFPMDGGRVLRAALALRIGRAEATRLAARAGQVLALAMAAVGLWQAPMLVFIALFVWLGAQQELVAARVSARLGALKVSDAMVGEFRTLDFDTPLSEALELSVGGFQHDFPVRASGELVGVLSREALLEALENEGSNAPVGNVVQGPLTTLEPGTPLADAVKVMHANGARAAVVLDHGHLLGLLTAENVAERLVSSAVR